MRDPKTHAKVLALRLRAVSEATDDAWRAGDYDRWEQLRSLRDRIESAETDHVDSARWFYDLGRDLPVWRCSTIVHDNGVAELRGEMPRAKSIEERMSTAHRAFFDALDAGDTARKGRCKDLLVRLRTAREDLVSRTGWHYYLIGPESSYWRHIEIIPDTEEK